MPESSAVRDHLANERTQLAWLRTSANVIVVGLAVARFADGGEVSAASVVSGGLLILVGAVGAVYGTVRYRRAAEAIRQGDIEAIGSSVGPSVAALVLLVTVLVSAAVLLAGA
jgi:putative membrane protein